ncbi:PAS domain-containing sensor histidine kinase [Cupriavidus basilensis]|uniref:PAS domain-containing sensor histidine kinase n=1 Tax=Cupriavidus basilensis TaxID=68895 RepID=UPI0007508F52|nr:ATP-binding protein [Cupriavidus basilensis]
MNESFRAGDPALSDSRILLGAAALLAVAVFLIDALTPLDIAIAVLYVVVVLLVALTGSRRATLAVAVVCAVLTVIGFLLSKGAHMGGGSLARCVFSLLAIGITSLLAVRNLASNARLREQVQMLDMTHDAIVVYDLNDIITFWNHGAEEVYGWTAAQAIGQPMHTLTQTRFPIPPERIHEELLRNGRWDGELERVRRDGARVVISSRWALWRDGAGKPVAIIATNNDITERQRAEAALAQSEAFLAEAQQLSKTGSIAMRLPEGAMTWSDEAYSIFGYGRDVQPSAERVIERTHPEDLALVQAAREQARAGVPQIDVAHRLLLPDGTVKHVHLVARRTVAAAGRYEYVGALMDVTDTTLTQQALQRTLSELAHVMRVTTLGELAASIAHEVTQPIAAIVTCGDSALRWLNRPQPEVGEATESIRQMIRDARRSSEIIRQIRSMAQKRDPSYAEMDLNALVDESLALVRRELQDHHVEAELRLGEPPALICGDRIQLQQVLINLLMNAVQAMDSVGGRRCLRVATRAADERHVRVEVRDSGKGIAPEDAGRLFNAFFTTKGDGMGMGLSICRSIIEAHGGRIWAESPPEGGALLQVLLPLHEPDDGDAAGVAEGNNKGASHEQ